MNLIEQLTKKVKDGFRGTTSMIGLEVLAIVLIIFGGFLGLMTLAIMECPQLLPTLLFIGLVYYLV